MSKIDHGHRTVTVTGIPRVIDLGIVTDIHGHARRLLDFCVFGIVFSGQTSIEIGGERCALRAGDYYLLPARLPHRGLDRDRFDAIFFHFLGNQPTNASPSIELGLRGSTSPVMDYLSLVKFLEGQYRIGSMDSDQLGLQLLAVLGQVYAINHEQRSTVPDDARRLAGTVLELLRSDYKCDLSGPLIAARVGYSYSYLERVFRANYGRSIHQELLRARIQAAANALQMGKPIKDVARDVGFHDYYYFLKAFKRVKGVPPGSFQASHREIPKPQD